MQEVISVSSPSIQSRTIADQVAVRTGRVANLNRQPRLFDGAIRTFLFLCAFLSVMTTIGITAVLLKDAVRFFTDTLWLETNKALTQTITADQTIFTTTKTGREDFVVGNKIRFGSGSSNEVAEIVGLTISEDSFTFEVLRGVDGTTAIEHTQDTELYMATAATITAFLTGVKWSPEVGNFGILPLIKSTLTTTLIAMLIAVPLGLGTAIYLSEYASRKTRLRLKPILEILAGIPTVVYGYFALTLMTPLLQAIFGEAVQVYNQLSAGIVVGILIIPTVSSISEDAINAVPNALREASYGLGATRLETVFKVLLPAALSGISAAIILGVSRAFGETMIVLLAAGAGPSWEAGLFDGAETMAGHIARISTGDISYGSIQYTSVYAIGLTLFLMTLLLNFVSSSITRRFREIY